MRLKVSIANCLFGRVAGSIKVLNGEEMFARYDLEALYTLERYTWHQ